MTATAGHSTWPDASAVPSMALGSGMLQSSRRRAGTHGQASPQPMVTTASKGGAGGPALKPNGEAKRARREIGERLRIRRGEIGQVLAVDLDAGLVEAVDQLAVRDLVLPRGRVDARDPQAAEFALALLAVAVGVLPGALDGLARAAHELATRAPVALGLVENLLVPASLRDAALDTGHGISFESLRPRGPRRLLGPRREIRGTGSAGRPSSRRRARARPCGGAGASACCSSW